MSTRETGFLFISGLESEIQDIIGIQFLNNAQNFGFYIFFVVVGIWARLGASLSALVVLLVCATE